MLTDNMSKIIEIWAPKFSTKEVLISTKKVVSGTNIIKFTKVKSMEGKEYHIEDTEIRQCRVQPNGVGEVYVVPLSKFKI